MPYKLTAEGQLAFQEVNGQKVPIYVHADGKEAPIDAEQTLGTISRLNGEAKAHREAKEAAEAKLKGFEGITDPKEALKALATLKNLDDKKLVDAGEVERLKQELVKAADEKYAPFVKKAEELEQQLYAEKIGGAFARSKFIADKVAVPPDMVQAAFGSRFRIEDGKVVAYGADGNKLYSKTSLGNPADFEEALELLVDQYPHKASILKGTNASGTGMQGGGGQPTKTAGNFGGSKAERIAAIEAKFPDLARG